MSFEKFYFPFFIFLVLVKIILLFFFCKEEICTKKDLNFTFNNNSLVIKFLNYYLEVSVVKFFYFLKIRFY